MLKGLNMVWKLSMVLVSAALLAGCGEKEKIVYVELAPDGTSVLRYPPRKAHLTEVTEKFGALMIRPGKFSATSRYQPWSGWWHPKRDRFLFDRGPGAEAPLQKYDAYVAAKTGTNPGSAPFEEQDLFLYNPGAGPADGLCDALAAASLLEREPLGPVTVNGIAFEVQDLKALLVKTYEQLDGTDSLGERNNDANQDYQDMYPDQFHRFVQRELQERGRPFYYDRDPTRLVWNTPVHRMEGEIRPDPANPHAMHVDVTLVAASPFVDRMPQGQNFVGRLEVLHQYTYTLYGDPRPDGFHVVYGEWTGDSVLYHPDFVTLLPESLQHENLARLSNNDKIDVKLVDEILSHATRRDNW
jgi:hypothetical protein